MQCRLLIASEITELRRMSAWLREQMDAADVNATAAHALELCANEAVANIMMHARHAPPAAPIGLTFRSADKTVELLIEDQAATFDPMSAALPDAPATLDEATPGGKGLVLIQRLLPRSTYERRAATNVLVLKSSR